MRNRLLNLCSIVLTLVMLFHMLPHQVLADTLATGEMELPSGNISTGTEELDASTLDVVEEVTEKRTEFSKEFRMSNGLHMAAVYGSAVHYEDNGTWKEIDNTLIAMVSGTDSVYTNTAGVWNISFPQSLSSNDQITITKDGYTLRFGLAGQLSNNGAVVMSEGAAAMSATDRISSGALAVQEAQSATAQIQQIDTAALWTEADHPETVADKLNARLQYSNVYSNTNVIYDLQSNTLKESIVIGRYDSNLRGYRYTLDVGTMVPVLNDDNSIWFYDSDREEVVMVMPAPFMLDADNVYNGDVEVILQGAGSSYTLLYLLPAQWLAAEDRAWPVVLDPIISAEVTPSNVRDVIVAENAVVDYLYPTNSCGYGQNWGIHRFFVKYAELPTLSSADVIVSANIRMYKEMTSLATDPMEVHKVLDTWDSQGMTWSNKPDFDPNIEDFVMSRVSGNYYWDITDIVRGWYEDQNTGMMFKATDAVEAAQVHNFEEFRSADYNYSDVPELSIYFRNNNGLESYWDYTASSAGRAGTGYVNNYTGNLVWVHNDIGFGGNRMPVSICHVYNANDSKNNTFGMGYGWRTNFNQRVYQWSQNSNYYVWEDSDGTDHYFYKKSSGTYVDEDGLELTLTTTGSSTTKYCISDKNGNKSYFDTYGRLTKQQNNQATVSSINIAYTTTSGYLISKITDGVGRVYNFTYSGGLLNRISYTGTGTEEVTYVAFEYGSSKLTSITNKDGGKAQYGYSGYLLTFATDIDGYQLTYTYSTPVDDWQPYRVQSVKESDDGVNGGELSIQYDHNQTTFTDHNNNQQIVQFNNWGNTIAIQDGEGHAQYAQYATDSNPNSGKGNQLSVASKLQNTVGCTLRHHSFENGTVWSAISPSVTCSVSSTHGYIGSKSLVMTRSTAGSASGVTSGSVAVEPGRSYTFSAFVKTGAGSAYLALHDGITTVTSEVLAANNDWTRLEVTYINDTSASKTIFARLMTADAGTTYIDCVQLENAATASRYNLIENGDFRFTTGWSSASGRTIATAAAPQLSTNVYKLSGTYNTTNRISQTVTVSGNEGDTFVLAGWAKGNAAPLTQFANNTYDSSDREFGIIAVFNYTDGTTSPILISSDMENAETINATKTDSFKLHFNPDVDNWQYAAIRIVAEKDYSSITVYLAYDHNANTVYFDGIQLYKEQFGSSYTYDDNGNVVSVVDLQKQTTTYEYDTNNNLTKMLQDNVAKMTYTYDSYHNVLTATSAEGLVYNFAYDTYGNNTSVSVRSGDTVMTSSAQYTDDGNRLYKTTDAAGNVTSYDYDANTNVLRWVKSPNDTDTTKTTYSYDNMYRLAAAAASTGTQALSAEYTYENDLLTQIETNSTTYKFGYGSFGLRKSVAVGKIELASYGYTEDRNNYLDTLEYGNGDSVQYTYDDLGRVIEEEYEDDDTVTYAYDNDGALATVTDSATGRTTTYYYDFTDRLMKYVESGSGFSHSVGYTYDDLNNLTALVETINGSARVNRYTYDADNRVTQFSNGPSGNGVLTTEDYSYDVLGRLRDTTVTHNGTVVFTDNYTYRTVNGGTTSQVSTLTTDAAKYDIVYSYTYDGNGNITSVSNGTSTTRYTYDSQNQLLREDNQAGGFTHVWAYDDAGNITSRKEYAYTTGTLGSVLETVTYNYGNTNWGDLLTAYGDQTITYDGIGNPLTDGTWTYTWEHGRELATISYAPEITITAQPRDFSGAVGETMVFSVSATGTGLTYQWQWREPGTAWSNTTVTGNTTNSITMPLTEARIGHEYRCVITDANGNKVATEAARANESAISITAQPQDVLGSVGSRPTMTVTAQGTDLTYQWQWRANSSCAWASTSLAGSQTNTITIPITLERTGNQYRCVITDSSGNTVASDYGEVITADRNWAFTYDANGMRTKRTNGTTTYEYVYNGSSLSYMSVADNTLYFSYGADGKPVCVLYNGLKYFYVTNLQGDVTAILDRTGNAVVTYTYDAWGNILSMTGSSAMTLGKLNPLRYRGYVYDQETELYYLQSRYYDPQLGRFINADALVSTGQGLLGNNMFVYCNNNPIINIDPSGNACTDIFAVYYGQGEYSELPSRLCIPNAKRTDSLQDMVDVSIDFFGEVIDSQPVQGALAIESIASGAGDFYTGAIVLFTPDPIPIADEIVALWTMISGLYNVLVGTQDVIDSITWEEGR